MSALEDDEPPRNAHFFSVLTSKEAYLPSPAMLYLHPLAFMSSVRIQLIFAFTLVTMIM